MNEDELRERLRRLDPVPDDVVMEPSTIPSSRARLEKIMNTNPPSTPSVDDHPASSAPHRTRWIIGAAAVVSVAAIGIFAILSSGDDDTDVVASGPPLELSLGVSDVMASCMVIDADTLSAMSPAFAATATEVGDETVTLEVDRWYVGGDAETVALRADGGSAALIAGFEFALGEQYLITAVDGSVNYCGFSGPATPELTALFEEAFAD